MSVANAHAFMKAIADDADFRTFVERASDTDCRQALKSSGYTFTMEEMQSLMQQDLRLTKELLEPDSLTAARDIEGDTSSAFFFYFQLAAE